MFKNKTGDVAAMPVASKKLRKLSRDKLLTEHIPMIIMLAPFLIFFFVFTILPILSSIVLSFTSFDMISSPKFVWLDNYRRMIVEDSTFATTAKNTLVFAIIAGPCGFLLSFVLAWFVNEFQPRTRAILSFMFYAPSLVGNAYFI